MGSDGGAICAAAVSLSACDTPGSPALVTVTVGQHGPPRGQDKDGFCHSAEKQDPAFQGKGCSRRPVATRCALSHKHHTLQLPRACYQPTSGSRDQVAGLCLHSTQTMSENPKQSLPPLLRTKITTVSYDCSIWRIQGQPLRGLPSVETPGPKKHPGL